MADAYGSAQWHVSEGREDEFVAAWREFLTWTRDSFGDRFERARLLRDERDPRHFVSFVEWDDLESRERWRNDPGFGERLAAIQALCRESDTGTYEESVSIG